MKYIAVLLLFTSVTFAQDAKEIVKKSNDLIRAASSYAEVKMKVIKPDWQREMTMKMWSLEPDYSLVLMTAPAKDKGTVTLKRKLEVWNWIPSVNRTIKIPPSMMLQSWMGSDFTNDDLVKQSSIVEDYTHEIIGEETLEGYECYVIKLTPKPDAAVVWGKIITYISKKEHFNLKEEYYDEDEFLIKTMIGSAVKKLDDRRIPTHWEMIPEETPGQKTVMDYLDAKFNIKIKSKFFSQRNMKKVR
jgi:outer membrane lipoprotein-sorting protein